MQALRLRQIDAFLRYVELPGHAPARVYLHGLGLSSGSLVQVAACAPLSGRRSLLVDLLGFGVSDMPDDFGYTVEDHAETVVHLLDERGIHGCELVGHSLGGSIAIVVASRRPDLVSSLAVIEANLDPGMGPVSAGILAAGEQEYIDEGFATELLRSREDARTDPQRVSAVTYGMNAIASARATYRTARSLTEARTPTFRELLVDMAMARSFLVGSRTLEADEQPASGESGAGLDGTGVRRFVVPNAGHLMMLENPEDFALTLFQALSVGGETTPQG